MGSRGRRLAGTSTAGRRACAPTPSPARRRRRARPWQPRRPRRRRCDLGSRGSRRARRLLPADLRTRPALPRTRRPFRGRRTPEAGAWRPREALSCSSPERIPTPAACEGEQPTKPCAEIPGVSLCSRPDPPCRSRPCGTMVAAIACFSGSRRWQTDPFRPDRRIGATATAEFVELVRFAPQRPRWSRPSKHIGERAAALTRGSRTVVRLRLKALAGMWPAQMVRPQPDDSCLDEPTPFLVAPAGVGPARQAARQVMSS